MGKNIVLVGLIYDNNLGDLAIFQSTKRMLSEILKENNVTNIEIRDMDMTGRISLENNPYMRSFQYRIRRKICKSFSSNYFQNRLKLYESRDICFKVCKNYIDHNTAAIIFTGGGLIKYKCQFLHNYIDTITKYAEKLGIPVIISGAGVEGYDENNKDCLILKRALNRSCVKYITTRDDIDTLSKYYCTNKQIIAKVADPACSLNSVYIKQKNKDFAGGVRRIGLGVVREGLFIDNGIEFDKQQMLDFWKSMYESIIEKGHQCKLFCNGARSDEAFALELLDYMNIEQEQRENIICRRPVSVENLVDLILDFDAVIVGRLHASIIAYAYGVPSLGLVWNDKQVMFGETIGYPERFIKKENFNVENIISYLEVAITQGYDEINREKYIMSTSIYLEKFLKEYVIFD